MDAATVKPWVQEISDQLMMEDLIGTTLEEAQAKLDKRVAENKIALASQEAEWRERVAALEHHLREVAAWNKYKAGYIADAKQTRD